MGKYGSHIIVFVICFAIAFGGGYLIFKNKETATNDTQNNTEQVNKDNANVAKEGTSDTKEGRIFVQRGCIGCHAVSSLNIQGGATGPDLSKAYQNVEGKHGVPIEQFLRKPTSAVMSGVLGSDPLTDEELQALLAALKVASEAPSK